MILRTLLRQGYLPELPKIKPHSHSSDDALKSLHKGWSLDNLRIQFILSMAICCKNIAREMRTLYKNEFLPFRNWLLATWLARRRRWRLGCRSQRPNRGPCRPLLGCLKTRPLADLNWYLIELKKNLESVKCSAKITSESCYPWSFWKSWTNSPKASIFNQLWTDQYLLFNASVEVPKRDFLTSGFESVLTK
jgi:hypothetical protein